MLQQPLYYEYAVRAHDTLSHIIFNMYHIAPRDSGYRGALAHLLALNPEIKDPNRIRIGQILRIGEYPPPKTFPFASRPRSSLIESIYADTPDGHRLHEALKGHDFVTEGVDRFNRDAFWLLSWMEHSHQWLTVPGGIALGATSNLFSPGNRHLVDGIADLYAQYKSGAITKGVYDSQRRLRLNQFKQRIGPVERLLFGNHTAHQTIRIARAGGVPATANIARHSQRLKNLATVGRMGGFVLTGVGAAAGCMQIAHTQDQNQKNEILVETLGSTATSVVGGIIVGAFLISNPVGWGMALALAAGTAVVSRYAGKGLTWAYDNHSRKHDLVSDWGVDKVCR